MAKTRSVNNIEIQGHRGCRGLLPENSLEAFEHAVDLGVHTLELDLAISKDHKVVVSHEPFMSRWYCLDPEGNNIPEEADMMHNLYQMNYEEIKRFDCGTKIHSKFPEQIKIKTFKPLLSEVIERIETKNSRIRYNLEIKAKPRYDQLLTPDPETFTRLVLEVIEKQGVASRSNLQSFDLRILEQVKYQDPNMTVALLVDENEAIATKLSQLSYIPKIISPYYRLVTPIIVEKYQSRHFKIIPWTVNEDADLKRMIDYGVDGIITDYPNRLIALLEKN